MADAMKLIKSDISTVHLELLSGTDVPVLDAAQLCTRAAAAEEVYELGQVLGQGAFGTVRRGVAKGNDAGTQVVAVKSITLGAEGSDNNPAAMRTSLRREVTLLQQVSAHEGIVHLLDAFESPPVVTLVLELCEGGDLCEVLSKRGIVRESEARTVMSQLTDALAFMHARGIIHRDLKPENIMIAERLPPSLDLMNARTKLVDLGLARVVRWRRSTTLPAERGNRASRASVTSRLRSSVKGKLVQVDGAKGRVNRISVAGTRGYLAPEFEAAKADGHVDINIEGASAFALDAYSLGVILQEMLIGTALGDGAAGSSCCFGSSAVLHVIRDASELSKPARELIEGLMHDEPERRMTMTAAKQAPFVLGV